MLTREQAVFAESCRTGHLATADRAGRPHVVPVCFAYVTGDFWIAVDEKPKRTQRLKRLRNIAANPHVSLVFDRYDQDWARLAYVLVLGKAQVTERGDAHPEVLAALRRRYPQYEAMALEERPVIRVTPEKAIAWGDVR